MPLNPETIAALIAKRDAGRLAKPAQGQSNGPTQLASKKLIRTSSQYPSLVTSRYITMVDEMLICVSRGCRTPTRMKVRGMGLCMTHAFHELNNIIESLEIKLTQTNGANITNEYL